MELHPDFWRRCSSCKTPIKYSSKYYVCSVSTCNRKRIGYVFDSVHCWERHLPGARHKDAAAVEEMSPSFAQWKAELGPDAEPPRTASGSAVAPSGTGAPTAPASPLVTPKPTSPTPEQQAAAVAAARSPQRVILNQPSSSAMSSSMSSSGSSLASKKFNDALESEILIVVSKMKAYIKERADMNTADAVSQVLSDRVRRLCDRAIEVARADGRKTVMDRDFDR